MKKTKSISSPRKQYKVLACWSMTVVYDRGQYRKLINQTKPINPRGKYNESKPNSGRVKLAEKENEIDKKKKGWGK